MLNITEDFTIVRDLGGAYQRYNMSDDMQLRDVYGRWSDKKERAYNYCRELMLKYDGNGFRIISANTFMFTVGFEFPHPETGEPMFAYITPDYNRCAVIE